MSQVGIINNENMQPCTMVDRIIKIEENLRRLDSIDQSVKNIETALIGSEKIGLEGMVSRVNKHEKSIQSMNRIIWIGTGCAGLIVVLWEVIKVIR
jgi:hypothetical protein